jgi:pimeloyl-ACP methyl ester carboxylesterase
MERYYLTEITTKDGLIHQGVYFQPKKKSQTAVLWLHGLSSAFYNNPELFEQISRYFEKSKLGFAAFNNRGHNSIAGIKKVDPESPTGYSHTDGGVGYEKFNECIYDIDAGLTFLIKQGYTRIILAGHSTGANKACFYGGTVEDDRVAGIILASPMSDRLIEEKSNPDLKHNLVYMQKMVDAKKGETLVNGMTFFPVTPRRYLSLFAKGSAEDVFDYGEINPEMKAYRNIKKPLLVVFAENDEYADRPIEEIKSVFDKYTGSENYQSKVIPGSFHGYDGMKDVFAKLITKWIISIKK